jgi:hypothetical protein
MKKSIVYTLIFAGVLFCGTVLAQVDNSVTNTKEAQTKVPVAREKAKTIAYCNDVEKNVAKRVTNFENNKKKHELQYKKTQTRVLAIVDALEDEGKDVSALRANMVVFEQMISKFGTDYGTYMNGLQGTEDFACGKSEGEFKAKLGIARAQLKVVHDDSVGIRTYWAQTVKPAILALKDQSLAETTTTTTEALEEN